MYELVHHKKLLKRKGWLLDLVLGGGLVLVDRLPVDAHHPPLNITISINFKTSTVFLSNYHILFNFLRLYSDLRDLE